MDRMPRVREKREFEVETISKPSQEYNTDEYFGLDLPSAAAVIVSDDVVE